MQPSTRPIVLNFNQCQILAPVSLGGADQSSASDRLWALIITVAGGVASALIAAAILRAICH